MNVKMCVRCEVLPRSNFPRASLCESCRLHCARCGKLRDNPNVSTYCNACNSLIAKERRIREPKLRPLSPCTRCGGPKSRRGKPGGQLCDQCRDQCIDCGATPEPNRARCPDCRKIDDRQRARRPEAIARRKKMDAERSSWYNLARYQQTPESYLSRLFDQGGGCKTCFITDPGKGKRYFNIDHDHDCPICKDWEKGCCGQCIRGLLCYRCNCILGFAKDNPDLLENLAQYLRAWNQQKGE